MKSHAQHLEALEALVVSDDPLAAFEHSALADCAECRTELEQLRATEALVATSLVAEQASIRASEEVTDPVGEHLVEAFLRPRLEAGQRAAATPSPTPARPRLLRWLVPLAAAALVLLFVMRPDDPTSPGTQGGGGLELLGPGSVELELPASEAASFEQFRWRGELPRNGWFILKITDPATPNAAPLFEGRVKSNEWAPRAAELEAWPQRIAWEVQVFNSSNGLEGSSPRRVSQLLH